MKTLKDTMIEALTSRLMSKQQANDVIDKVKDNPILEEHSIKWDTEYPEAIQKVTWIYVLKAAQEYIEESCPQAFFRPLFFEEEMDEIMSNK